MALPILTLLKSPAEALAAYKALPAPVAKLVLGSAIAWTGTVGAVTWAALALRPDGNAKAETVHALPEPDPAAGIGHLQEPVLSDEERFANAAPAADPHPKAEAGHSKPEAHGHGETHTDTQAEAHADAPKPSAHGDAHGHPVQTHTAATPGSEKAAEVSVTVDGEDARLLRQLVEEYARSGQVTRALPFLERALRSPDHPASFLAIAARIMMANGRYESAGDLAEKALKTLPDRHDMAVLAMMATYRRGQVDEAMNQAMQLLQKHPRDVDLLTALGTMHSEQNPHDATSDGYLAQALQIKPDHLPALYQVGRRFMRAKKYAEAEKTFTRVLALHPGYAKGHAQLGMALYYQERFEPARQAFISALQAAPRDYNTWFNLGEVYLQQAAELGADKAQAVEALRQRAFSSFNEAIELHPDHAMAHFRLGVLLIGNNQIKEAIRHLEYAVRLQDDLVGAWLQLALAYESMQLFEKARLCLDKAYELDPLNKVVALKLREWG